MSKDTSLPIADPDAEVVGQFVFWAKMMIKAGISFEDPRMKPIINQLGIWPQLVFDLQVDDKGASLTDVRIDETQRIVNFNLTLIDIPDGDNLIKRAETIIKWCQQLLGEDWSVNINNRKKNKGKYKSLFKGNRLEPVATVTPTLIDAPFPEVITNFRRYRSDGKNFRLDDDILLDPIK